MEEAVRLFQGGLRPFESVTGSPITSNLKGGDMKKFFNNDAGNASPWFRKVRGIPMLVGVAAALNCMAAAAEDFQATSVMATYSAKSSADPVFGSGTSNEHLATVRFEHFGAHSFGDNYFFVDALKGGQLGGANAGSFGFGSDRGLFLVWNARASLSKISGTKVGFGPVSDVSLMYRMERGSYANYSANMIGPSFNLAIPGFVVFQTSFLVSKQDHSFATSDDRKSHLFWHNVAILPFALGDLKFTFTPMAWVNFSRGLNGRETYIGPDLWVKAGTTPVELGFRLTYHRYENYSRTSPTLLAKWNF